MQAKERPSNRPTLAKVPKLFQRSAQKSTLAVWYNRIAAFNVEALFSTKRPPGPPRTIYVHETLPSEYHDQRGRVLKQHTYRPNQIITSKYNLLTFLPRNLLEQFRRVANIYFLFIAVLQFFPKFSTISPGVVILPLAIIIGLTAIKDGYEDYKRHQADREVNQNAVKVLQGGGWQNPNSMQGKKKTFVRRLIPSRRPRKLQSGEKGWESNSDIEFDSQTPEERGSYGQQAPHWKSTLWEDLRVGDFIKLNDHDPIPADVLICATSEEENVCFVETKNLDGETNLKSRRAVSSLTDLRNASACADSKNAFHVDCDRPDNNMYRLNAAVDRNGEKSSVNLEMVLLRGTILRNTEWAIGVVLYTGEDTKVVMNSGGTPSKRSKVEMQMNPQVLVNLALLAVMATICAIADSSLEKEQYPQGALWLYGDDRGDDNPSINGIVTWCFALLTFQDIVPISLYLSIEIVRTIQAAFIYFDSDIWYSKTNQPTLARSWNLSDDLGQIEFIFSDKTGTLTQNLMVFRQASIGGVAYYGDEVSDDTHTDDYEGNLMTPKTSDEPSSSKVLLPEGPEPKRKRTIPVFRDTSLQSDIEQAVSADPNSDNAAHARLLNGFFSVLALCHTVLTYVDPKTGEVEYKAQSPDEQALVQAAADVGFVFKGRDSNLFLTLQTPSSEEDEKYELLNILEFSSARKRMSVIVRKLNGEDSRIFLLSKGADNVIFERLKQGNDEMKVATEQHLAHFASEGLRTLTLAYKVVGEEEYNEWNSRYHDATVALDDREDKIETVSEEMERDLRLLGATAIEDKLQDGVPETIADLKRAGIKLWVLTGDKLETAIAIGRSTNLISEESNLIVIRGGAKRPVHTQLIKSFEQFFPGNDILDSGEVKEVPSSPTTPNRSRSKRFSTASGMSDILGEGNGERPGGKVLVIDGAGLQEAFAEEASKDYLLRLGMLCEGVICCRVSPLQKALVVRLVKDGIGAMALAIGDGANDVSMIQAADVGVGISGEEGLQAVNSADYAIAQFRFLKKLLLVHGHWSYSRNGVMISNFFYKNMVPTGMLFWWQIWDAWSAYFVFSYVIILLWNSIFTVTPVVFLGLFDRIADARDLMDYPELYRLGREGSWFGFNKFFIYMLDAVYQSVVIYFFVIYSYMTNTTRADGYDVNQAEFAATLAVSTVTIVNLYIGFTATAWTGWLFFGVFVEIVIIWVFTPIYSAIDPSYAVTEFYGDHILTFHSPTFWLTLPLTLLLSLAPRYIAKTYKMGYQPGDLELVKIVRKRDPGRLIDLREIRHEGKHDESDFGLSHLKRSSVVSSRRTSRTSFASNRPRPSLDVRCASRTDMSTGIVSVERGFGFATEEAGAPGIQRVQTDLSSRRIERGGKVHHGGSLFRKGKGSIGRARTLSVKLKGRIAQGRT